MNTKSRLEALERQAQAIKAANDKTYWDDFFADHSDVIDAIGDALDALTPAQDAALMAACDAFENGRELTAAQRCAFAKFVNAHADLFEQLPSFSIEEFNYE